MDLLQACINFPKLLDELFASIQHALILTNPNGQILLVNHVVESVLGYQPDELEFGELSLLFTPEDMTCLYPNLLYMAGKNRRFEGEAMLRRKDGSRFFAFLTFLPIVGTNERERRIVMTVQDIGDIKEMEKAALENRSDDLAEVAVGLTREIRKSLVNIDWSVNRLLGENLEHLKEHKDFEEIKGSVQRIEDMAIKFERLITMSRPNFTRINIYELIDEVTRPYLSHMADKYIVFELEAEEEMLLLDKRLVIKAFSLLMDNAMASVSERGGVSFTSELKENQYRLHFHMSHPEYTADELDNIFNPFFSTQSDGIGLDMTMIKLIMAFHHGRIEAISEEGRGTTFILSFPWERRRYIRNWLLEDEASAL